ncbi:cytotoxic T-lymphocyte protein 4 [Aquarana catesbeiana]|uniref:cytotoxic T-lymphocyte protein 4 n=1 Tax=Aquarana catesbeiana TaxID=8400 RepID=UPI003CCA4EA8
MLMNIKTNFLIKILHNWITMFAPIFIGISWFYISTSEGAEVSQPAVVVANRHGEATLDCGYEAKGMEEEIRFSLLKKIGNQLSEVCVLSFSTAYKPDTSGNTFQCLGIPGPRNVIFNISGLQVEDTGLYFCKLEVMYPPPYRITEGNAMFIYVSDLRSQCAQSMEPVESKSFDLAFLIIILVMLVYSLLVTSVLICKRRKRRWDTGHYGQVLQSNNKNYHPYYIKM